jgi:hypothetical protein
MPCLVVRQLCEARILEQVLQPISVLGVQRIPGTLKADDTHVTPCCLASFAYAGVEGLTVHIHEIQGNVGPPVAGYLAKLHPHAS